MMIMYVFLPIFSLSVSSLWLMWILMELMTFFFVPWLLPERSRLCFHKMFQYFVFQSIASSLFLFSSILLTPDNEAVFNLLISFSMWLKIGVFPFFTWISSVIEMMDWSKYIIFLTYLKMIPVNVMIVFQNLLPLASLLSLSSLVGLKSLSCYSLRQLMLISSVSHMAWLLMSAYVSKSLFLIYFFIYYINLLTIQYVVEPCSVSDTKNTYRTPVLPTLISVLSLSGLPPFTMFFLKLWVTQGMLISGNMIEVFIILFASIFPIYIYLMIFFMIYLLTDRQLQSINKIVSNAYMKSYAAMFVAMLTNVLIFIL